MWQRVEHNALWVLSVLWVFAGSSMLYEAFSSEQAKFMGTFVGLICLLTGAAIYLHAIRTSKI